MAVPEDFCIFILTHGRPDRVYTYDTVRKAGYTGKVYLVIDDEDKTADEYRERYGAEVLQFAKSEIAATFDEGDNFNDRRTIVYARNACWSLAEQVGCRHFVQFDDDYTAMFYRFDSSGRYGSWRIRSTLDPLLVAMVDLFDSTPVTTVAMAQGGDFIGGVSNTMVFRRKAMNSFVCSTDRPFQFFGRINEDVNAYTTMARRGALFFTVMQAQLCQKQTQSNAGGMTDLYLDSGTYVKSFYSVLYCPSGVKVGEMGDPRGGRTRLHHVVNWHKIAPKILNEDCKK
tara:strand:+ start:477 stop:1331 length:855 start_codon:yes stop_codon:yes gene_type:complete